MRWKHFISVIAAGLIVALDVWLKKYATENSWIIHKNTGIAFDLPLWPWIAILLIVLISAGLFILSFHHRNSRPWLSAAALVIIVGAIGNLIDRFSYGFVVDYIIFKPTESAFNLSDLVIIAGILIFILSKRK